MISQETIEQVVAASDIVEVIGSYFPLKRAGIEFRALCPFHQEKTPSFYVHPDKQTFHCFGCGTGGAVIQFVQRYENIDFPEAVRRLAARAGIALVEDEFNEEEEHSKQHRKRLLRLHFEVASWFHRNLLRLKAADHARQYLKGRGMNIHVAKNWMIGYAPNSWMSLIHWAKEAGFTRQELLDSGLVKLRDPNDSNSKIYDRFRDRLMFPIRNELSEVIAFSGRVLDSKAPGGKYVNSPESPLFSKGSVLFGFDQSKRAIANSRTAIVLEGQADLITLFEAGVKNVVAPQGTALTERHATLLRRFADEVILFFDADAAGEKAAERALEILLAVNLQVRVGDLPPGEDPDSLVRSAGVEAFENLLKDAKNYFDREVEKRTHSTELQTTTGRIAFARKMVHFLSVVPDAILRDTLLNRLAKRLSLPQDALFTMLRTESKSVNHRHLSTEIETKRFQPPPHDIVLLCQILLHSAGVLEWVRQHPWEPILKEVQGGELPSKLLSSKVNTENPVSLAAFLATLSTEEAALVSYVSNQKPIDPSVGKIYWTDFALRELARRKLQLESVVRLANETVTMESAQNNIKEVLDLESRIKDISSPLGTVS
jgi:DNA primase